MENLKQFSKRVLKEESAQGATEYILLLVAVVAVLAIFKDTILNKVRGLLDNVSAQIDSVAQ